MKTLNNTMVAAVLTAMVAAASLASVSRLAAQDGPSETKTQLGKKLTDATLEQMLSDLGYEFKITKETSRTYYGIDMTRDNFRYIVDLSLDSKGKRIWFSVPLKKLEPAMASKVGIERLWKLLEKNDEIYPASFSYEKSRNRFYITYAIDNRGITPGVLREELESVLTATRTTYDLWNTAKWPELGGSPAPDAAPVVKPNRFEAPSRKFLAALQETVVVLSLVEDAESAQTAAAQLKTVAEKLQKIQADMKALGQMTKEEEEQVTKKFGTALVTARNKVKTQTARLAGMPEVLMVLKDGLTELTKVDSTLVAAR